MKFKVGDLVTVFKPSDTPKLFASKGVGWNPHMDKFIGKEVTITNVDVERNIYHCESGMDNSCWSWKEEWLQDPFLKLVEELVK